MAYVLTTCSSGLSKSGSHAEGNAATNGIIYSDPRSALPALPSELGTIYGHTAHYKVRPASRSAMTCIYELVLDPPGGGVAHDELALQLQRPDVVLRLTDQEHRLKPCVHGELRAMEDRPRLRSTAAAFPIAGSLNIKATMRGSDAVRAVKALGPASLFQGLLTLSFYPVLLKQLRQAHALLNIRANKVSF